MTVNVFVLPLCVSLEVGSDCTFAEVFTDTVIMAHFSGLQYVALSFSPLDWHWRKYALAISCHSRKSSQVVKSMVENRFF